MYQAARSVEYEHDTSEITFSPLAAVHFRPSIRPYQQLSNIDQRVL